MKSGDIGLTNISSIIWDPIVALDIYFSPRDWNEFKDTKLFEELTIYLDALKRRDARRKKAKEYRERRKMSEASPETHPAVQD